MNLTPSSDETPQSSKYRYFKRKTYVTLLSKKTIPNERAELDQVII